MKNSIIGIAALVLPLALVAPSALAHDDFCYMEMDGQTVNLDHMCSPSEPATTARPASAPGTSNLPATTPEEVVTGDYIYRSTADANRSTANSFLRLSDVQVSGGYLTGTIVNQGRKDAEHINLSYDLLNPSGAIIFSSSGYPETHLLLAPQQRTTFRLYVGFVSTAADAEVVATWREWVQE